MSVVSINGALAINQEELSEFVRSEIDSSDFGCLMGDVVSEAMSEYDYDTMVDNIQELDASLDRHDDRLDDVEREVEHLKNLTNENREDWKAVRGESGLDREELRKIIGQEIDGFDLSGFKTSPEVDAALRKQHQRIMDLEAAMLAVFEYLNDESQRLLHGHAMAFDMKIKGGE